MTLTRLILFLLLSGLWAGTQSLAQAPSHRASATNGVLTQLNPSVGEFDHFLSYFQEKSSISQEWIIQFLPRIRPKGNFKAMATYRLPQSIQALVLLQKAPMCTRQYLITTDGKRILHQAVLGERCTPAPSASENLFSVLSYQNGEGFVQTYYQERFLPEHERKIVEKRFFEINGQGEILPTPKP